MLQMKATQTQEELAGFKAGQQKIETHIMIALKDVQSLQTSMVVFKESLELRMKEEVDQLNTKMNLLKLNIKQTTDILDEVKKESTASSVEIRNSSSVITCH